MAQVLAGEAQVARLLRDVNPHHALHERMHGQAGLQDLALCVVDRLLAAEHEQKEQFGERAAEPCHSP